MNDESWFKFTPSKCDLCDKIAVWSHTEGSLRCADCPRPKLEKLFENREYRVVVRQLWHKSYIVKASSKAELDNLTTHVLKNGVPVLTGPESDVFYFIEGVG